MKIHTLAERTGLSASAIRFYEKQGLLDSRHVRRGANNYRDYSEAAVRHLEMIKKVQSVGFTLSELKEVVQAEEANAPPLPKKIELLRHKLVEIERKKEELEQVQTHIHRMLANKLALMGAAEKGEV
ncbi:MerR family transcriptional regulator [Paenibacillus sp. P25]|nr:MerR family transcriptional regulator [Paenibacillus sp. P25]